MANMNYVQGVATGTAGNATSQYNLLISGGDDYKQSSGLYLANDIRSNKGAQLMFANNGNTFMDFNAAATNAMNFRYTSNGVSYNNMLQLMTEDASNSTRYVADINGRLKASQYVVDASYNEARTIAGNRGALYMGQNNSGSYFIMNPNGNTAAFDFKVTNADGTANRTVMTMRGNGQIQTVFYNKTSNSDDSEAVAVAGFDDNGNLVRKYEVNARIRTVETAVSTIASSVGQGLTNKVNEVITRLNSLNFYSNNIKLYEIPPQVTGVAVANGGSLASGINVTFTAVTTNVSQSGNVTYNVALCNSAGSCVLNKNVTTSFATFTSANGLSAQTYTIYVKATNDSGTGITSAGVSYTVA
jgi:hypothetical protein